MEHLSANGFHISSEFYFLIGLAFVDLNGWYISVFVVEALKLCFNFDVVLFYRYVVIQTD